MGDVLTMPTAEGAPDAAPLIRYEVTLEQVQQWAAQYKDLAVPGADYKTRRKAIALMRGTRVDVEERRKWVDRKPTEAEAIAACWKRHDATAHPKAPSAEAVCTGMTAAWCPIHGDCKCDREHSDLDSERCPLHSADSEHAPAPEPAAPPPALAGEERDRLALWLWNQVVRKPLSKDWHEMQLGPFWNETVEYLWAAGHAAGVEAGRATADAIAALDAGGKP